MESGKCCNIFYQTQRKWNKVDWLLLYCPARLVKFVLLNTSGYCLISTSTSTPNEGFFRDSSKLCIAWSIILAWDIGYFMLWPCHAGQGAGCTRSTIWVDYASENRVPQSEFPMYVNSPYNSKDNKNTMQVYLVTDVIALEAGQSSQGHLRLLHRSSW